MSRPRAYLAGPMRGYKNYNFNAFDVAANRLRGLGYAVINPADIDRVYYDVADYIPHVSIPEALRALRRDLEFLFSLQAKQGDIIYFLAGWEQSKGSLVELACAKFINLKVYCEFISEPPAIETGDTHRTCICETCLFNGLACTRWQQETLKQCDGWLQDYKRYPIVIEK